VLETWKSNPAFTMHLKLGLFVLGMASCLVLASCQNFPRAIKQTIKCSISAKHTRAPNTCFRKVREKTEFTFAGFNDDELISSSNNFLHPKRISKDGVYTTDCAERKEAVTEFCKLIMSKTDDCSLDGKTEFTSILTTKKTMRLMKKTMKTMKKTYCLKVHLSKNRYRYKIVELKDEKCAFEEKESASPFEEKESASLTSNAGLRNRRRQLLQDDTGSSGC
jgi:hypothetical protein